MRAVPTAHPTPADAATAALVEVSHQLPGGGEDREGQREMAAAIADAIDSRSHLVVQAGTGTGKSLAYLVPAILAGKRTVVATATKSLQDQLADRDLPFLAQAFPHRSLTWAVLKGRSNYVCMQRLDEIERARDGAQAMLDPEMASADARQIDEIVEWAETTKTGDRADLDNEPSAATWAAVSVSAQECPGAAACPAGDRCFAEFARQKAIEADVVVVNTHLYGVHMDAGNVILPPHEVLVIDEAHTFEDVVSSTMGVEITTARLTHAANATNSVLTDVTLPANLLSAATQLGEVLGDHVGERLIEAPQALSTALNLAKLGADKSLDALRRVPKTDNADATARALRAVSALTALSDDLATAADPAEGTVRFVDGDERFPRLRIAPIDVAGPLADHLWGVVDTVVLTSATIPRHIGARLGAPKATTEMDVGSPFDYPNQALLYCATSLPEPRSDDFAPAMHAELDRLIRAAGGRTLALFTSYRGMAAAVEAIGAALPFTVLVQGELPKARLIERFENEIETCLFATMGYWQGIDVPGPSLTLVTIDKLPFARPNDPLMEARRDAAGPQAFKLIDVPRTAALLAQGVGRLIRSSKDRGVVAIFDRRLSTAKSYRWEMISSLPPMERTKDRAVAVARLRELKALNDAAEPDTDESG